MLRPSSNNGLGAGNPALPCHEPAATWEGWCLLVEPASFPSCFPDCAATLPACCRAWRRIEDHIGTKTAVQIRSHAQKFFSKLEKAQAAGAKGAAHLCNTMLAQMRCMCSISLPVSCLMKGERVPLPPPSLALWRPADCSTSGGLPAGHSTAEP